MPEPEITPSYEIITLDDLPELTRVMTRAFDDDAQKHLGVAHSGPEGYDNGDFFRTWLFPYEESHGYKIMLRDQLVGAFIVWILPEGKNILGTIFIDPDFQDRGIASHAWQFIESRYPETQSWTLGTPSFAIKNHYFYAQKCGFTKIKEQALEDQTWQEWIYQKEMPPAA